MCFLWDFDFQEFWDSFCGYSRSSVDAKRRPESGKAVHENDGTWRCLARQCVAYPVILVRFGYPRTALRQPAAAAVAAALPLQGYRQGVRIIQP